ncbi:MAG TPA: plastocyanin/azurin family copper-binding protein [Candidatus Xenobia bacterium]|nr:plastocyanin/azurin family copper-binding protein [Candidatus Xenobia bacterium]
MSRRVIVLGVALVIAPAILEAAGDTRRPAGARAQGVRVIRLQGTDDMKFDVTVLQAARGERLRVVLTSVGRMPKVAMAHNFVLLAPTVDVEAFITASALARDAQFIAPAYARGVLAATGLAGAGESVEVTFTAPTRPGRYPFVCSFPGHYAAGMRGVLIVK